MTRMNKIAFKVKMNMIDSGIELSNEDVNDLSRMKDFMGLLCTEVARDAFKSGFVQGFLTALAGAVLFYLFN